MQPHGDIIGQSMCPEVWLARDIGAATRRCISLSITPRSCAGLEHEVLKEIFEQDAIAQSRIILEAVDAVDENASCMCGDLRKPTLL